MPARADILLDKDLVGEAAKTHPNYLQGPVRLDETSGSYVFSLPQDSQRQVSLAPLAFDLGVKL